MNHQVAPSIGIPVQDNALCMPTFIFLPITPLADHVLLHRALRLEEREDRRLRAMLTVNTVGRNTSRKLETKPEETKPDRQLTQKPGNSVKHGLPGGRLSDSYMSGPLLVTAEKRIDRPHPRRLITMRGHDVRWAI